MHALETVHSALRPEGLLLDVRPARQHPGVVMARRSAKQQGVRWLRLGQVDDSYRMGTLAIADEALGQVIDDGRFAPEREQNFLFIYHFDRVETWLAHMTNHWSTATLSGEMIARAKEEQARQAGEIRVLRVINAMRLRRT